MYISRIHVIAHAPISNTKRLLKASYCILSLSYHQNQVRFLLTQTAHEILHTLNIMVCYLQFSILSSLTNSKAVAEVDAKVEIKLKFLLKFFTMSVLKNIYNIIFRATCTCMFCCRLYQAKTKNSY